jgi:uncharacterized protein YneF (UPF0154 family)
MSPMKAEETSLLAQLLPIFFVQAAMLGTLISVVEMMVKLEDPPQLNEKIW